jgi:hypothetical protein
MRADVVGSGDELVVNGLWSGVTYTRRVVWSLVFIAVVGIAVVLGRRPLARMQGAFAGGRVLPGCVIAEGVALIVLALVLFLLYRAGAFA